MGARAACDPVAHEFCGNGPDTFRADLKAMNADGTGMSERLFRAWDSLRASPMDDTLGEGPHAQMKHVQIRTRAATWGWQAATVRLKQNLLDVEHVLPKVTPPTNLQWCWNRWTSVLQVHRGEQSQRNRRMKRGRVEEMVYTTKQLMTFEMEDMQVGGESDDGPDDGTWGP